MKSGGKDETCIEKHVEVVMCAKKKMIIFADGKSNGDWCPVT